MEIETNSDIDVAVAEEFDKAMAVDGGDELYVDCEDVLEADFGNEEVAAEAANAAEGEAPAEPLFSIDDLRYENAYPEPIPDESECTIYNGDERTSAKELLSGNSQPILAIRREIWEEIQHLVHLTPHKEMAMFLVLKRFKPNLPKFLAVDLYFPKQETGSDGVSIDVESTDKFYRALNEHPDFKGQVHRYLAHLHSHASMSTFWSKADDNQQLSHDDLGFYDDFRFYLVVNTKSQVRCSFVQYQPYLRRIDNLPIVVVGPEVDLSEERKSQLSSYIECRTSPLTTSVFEKLVDIDPKLTESYGKAVPKYEYGYGAGYKYAGGSGYKYGYGAYGIGRSYGSATKSSWSTFAPSTDSRATMEKASQRAWHGTKPNYDWWDDLEYGGPTSDKYYRDNEYQNEPIVDDFIEYCGDQALRLDDVSIEVADSVVSSIGEMSDDATAQMVHDALMRLSGTQRRLAIAGYAREFGLGFDRIETELPDDIVNMVEFLIDNDWRFDYLFGYLEHRNGSFSKIR